MKQAKHNGVPGSNRMVLSGIQNFLFHRRMMLHAAAILLLGCSAGRQLKAQHAIGLHGGVFKPVNSTAMQYGAGLDYTYQASDKVHIGIGAAYYAKSKVSSTRLNGIYTYTLREGVFSPYAGADLGLYFIDEYTGFRVYETMGVGLAPLLGAHYKLSEGLALDVRVKYPLILAIDKGGKGFFPTPYGLTALECNVGAIVFF